MTLDLDRLESLANAATPGPWKPCRTGKWEHDNYVTRADDLGVAMQYALVWQPADAEFIAAAREGVPELIAENRQLRGIVDELERELDAEAKHAALGPGEYCDVCTHSEAELMLSEAEDADARAESAEAERNALAARVAAVEDVLDVIDAVWPNGAPDGEIVVQRIRAALNHTGATTPESAAAGQETGLGAPSRPSGHTDLPPEIPGPQIGALAMSDCPDCFLIHPAGECDR